MNKFPKKNLEYKKNKNKSYNSKKEVAFYLITLRNFLLIMAAVFPEEKVNNLEIVYNYKNTLPIILKISNFNRFKITLWSKVIFLLIVKKTSNNNNSLAYMGALKPIIIVKN